MRIRRPPSLAAIRAWLGEQVQAQSERLMLWVPVAMGLGAATYLALPREPLAIVGWLMVLASMALISLARGGAGTGVARVAIILVGAALAGFGLAKLRTEAVRAPVAPSATQVRVIEAYVLDVASPGQGGPRLLLAPSRISGLQPGRTPIRVRITLKPETPLPAPGAFIRLKGMVNPPPPPASPGAYDFARDAFFEGVGGVGFALGPPEITARPTLAPILLRWQMGVNAARWALARRMVEIMGAERGGLAAAMVTGHEAYIPKAQTDALRAAGLAHIVSISGLHMAIVGGFAFGAARLGIAAWPWLALRLSGKKAAALVGLVAVGGYLALSGAPAPAERAAITAAAAFAAILFDRQAISLRTLALAALIIIALQPEAVAEPGFQMSFAATAALVALAELWPRPVREINTPWPIRMVQAVGVWTMASLAASFVAGLATGPFAIQHFNRVSTFGLATNLLVAPISSFLMMPALAVGAALTPLGLGGPPLAVAGFAIDLMTRIAAAAQAMPWSQLVVASAPGWALPATFVGIMWLCLWRGPLRWLGVPLALAINLAPRPPAPDIWVSADASTLAVRAGSEAIFLRPDAKLFAADIWSRRRGLVAGPDPLAGRDALFDCDRWSCVTRGEGPSLAAVWTRRASTIDKKLRVFCGRAEVIVVRGAAPACPGALVLDGEDFARGGSAELRRGPRGWQVTWAQPLRGERPWTRPGGEVQ